MKTDGSGHKRTVNNGKVSTKSEHKAGSKYNLSYWEKAVFQRRKGGNWWVQMQHEKRREKFSLRTPNLAAATVRARDAYQVLVSEGWDAMLAKYKPQSAPPPPGSTIGDFL